MQDGDILLCKGNSLTARLIMWGTGSVYSHVAVMASAKLGLIIEAIPKGGVRAISIENYKEVYDLYRVKDRSSFDLSEVAAYLVRMLARAYDFKSTLKLGWKLSLRKMGLVRLAGRYCEKPADRQGFGLGEGKAGGFYPKQAYRIIC